MLDLIFHAFNFVGCGDPADADGDGKVSENAACQAWGETVKGSLDGVAKRCSERAGCCYKGYSSEYGRGCEKC